MYKDDYRKNVKIIGEALPEACLWEQLAEECIELSHASLKMARKLRNENPTPLSEKEIKESIIEEYTDVALCVNMLRLNASLDLMYKKLQRWVDRCEEDKEN